MFVGTNLLISAWRKGREFNPCNLRLIQSDHLSNRQKIYQKRYVFPRNYYCAKLPKPHRVDSEKPLRRLLSFMARLIGRRKLGALCWMGIVRSLPSETSKLVELLDSQIAELPAVFCPVVFSASNSDPICGGSISGHKKNAATNKRYGGIDFLWRYRADSNRCSRFCRPVPNPSATIPFL